MKSNRSSGPKIAPPPAPLATKNSDDDVDSDGVAALGDMAHKVTVGERSQSASKKVKIITNQEELKKCMAANPNDDQHPLERKKLSKMMKLVTKSIKLEEEGALVLVDSGSAPNVAKVQTHYKEYANVVVLSSGSKPGESANTACGKQLTNH